MRKQLPPFTPMYVETIDSPAWRTLPHGARPLYVYMKRHYNRKQQKAVYLSIRVAAKELGASRNTIAGWLHALSIGGFIASFTAGSWAPTATERPRFTGSPMNRSKATPRRGIFCGTELPKKQNPGSKIEPPCSKIEPQMAQKLSHPKPKIQQNGVAQKLRHI